MFIELHNISRSFGTNHALVDVNLALEIGRIGLLGPNGGRQIDADEDPARHSAAVFWDGPRARSRSRTVPGVALRRAIGYMPEADALVPGMKGAEYVALAGELYGMAAQAGAASRP